jgi:hypothetical protein
MSTATSTAQTALADQSYPYWEFRAVDGEPSARYESIDRLRAAIIRGEIQTQMEYRRIDSPKVSVTTDMPEWQKVATTLAKSGFTFRVLFQPVWAHTLRGAFIAALAGALLWTVLAAVNITRVNETAGTVMWLFLAWSLWPIVRQYLQIPPRIGAVLPIIALWFGFQLVGSSLRQSTGGSFGALFASVALGVQAPLGAAVAGVLLFVFPGMVVGTVTGLVRRKRLAHSPFVAPNEHRVAVRKGILYPAIAWGAVVYLYALFIRFAPAWLAGSGVYE